MTRLPPMQELLFQNWYSNLPNVKSGIVNQNPDDPEHFYDYRAAWLNDMGLSADKNGHFPSKFKKMGHERYFLGGVDTHEMNPDDIGLQSLLGRPSLWQY